MLLAFSGSLIRAFVIFKAGPSSSTQVSSARWIEGMFHEAGILLLLGYILWRSGRSFRDIGFRWSFKEAAIGILLYVVAFSFYIAGGTILNVWYYALAGSYPTHVSALQVFGHFPLIALPFTLLNPFYEEIVVRAYLMTEIRELTGSVAIAAIASLVLQTSYHIYYGWAGAIMLGINFAVFVGYFAIWRRAFPLVVAHAIFDIVGYLRLR